MIFMCVCTSRPIFRCKHALRETWQQLSILPRNQIYSAAASYFRPLCSRSLLIARARQNPRAANAAAPKILQSNLCLQNCLPVTARRSWLQHYSTFLRRCNVEYRHWDDLVCLSVHLFVTLGNTGQLSAVGNIATLQYCVQCDWSYHQSSRSVDITKAWPSLIVSRHQNTDRLRGSKTPHGLQPTTNRVAWQTS